MNKQLEASWTYPAQIALQANLTVLLESKPGEAKTAFVTQLGQSLNWPVVCLVASHIAAEDISGYVVPDSVTGKCVHKVPDDWAYQLSQEVLGNNPAILFIDEASTAAPSTQHSLQKLVHERKAGKVILGSQVRIILASNPVDTNSGVFGLTAAISNRVIHLNWDMPPAYFADALEQGFPPFEVFKLEDDWAANLPKARQQVAAFLRVKPEYKSAEPESDDDRANAWPSCRTWEFATLLLAATEQHMEYRLELLEGTVGRCALELIANIGQYALPDPRQLCNSTLPLPSLEPQDEHIAYSIVSSLVHYLSSRARANELDTQQWTNGWEHIATIAKQFPGVSYSQINSLLKAAPDNSWIRRVPEQARDIIRTLGREMGDTL
jgi:hypothetical protein